MFTHDPPFLYTCTAHLIFHYTWEYHAFIPITYWTLHTHINLLTYTIEPLFSYSSRLILTFHHRFTFSHVHPRFTSSIIFVLPTQYSAFLHFTRAFITSCQHTYFLFFHFSTRVTPFSSSLFTCTSPVSCDIFEIFYFSLFSDLTA